MGRPARAGLPAGTSRRKGGEGEGGTRGRAARHAVRPRPSKACAARFTTILQVAPPADTPRPSAPGWLGRQPAQTHPSQGGLGALASLQQQRWAAPAPAVVAAAAARPPAGLRCLLILLILLLGCWKTQHGVQGAPALAGCPSVLAVFVSNKSCGLA